MNFKTHIILAAAVAATVGVTLPVVPAFGEATAEKTDNGYQVVFRLDASGWDDKPSSVNVAGDFNGWNSGADAMTDLNSDNIWELTMPMSPGQYGYKFVIDGDRWMTDPTDDAELREGDNYGGENSGVIVGPDIRKAPPPEEGTINDEFVRHEPVSDVVPIDNDRIRVRVSALEGDVKEAVAGVYVGEGNEGAHAFPMRKVATAGGYDVFEAVVMADGRDEIRYAISASDGSARVIIDEDGVRDRSGQGTGDVNPFVVAAPSFDVPEWAADAVWYQIFPERFRNGDTSNDPGQFDYELLVGWTTNWWDVLEGETPPDSMSDNFYNGTGDVWDRRYGGDLQGVREKLPYLKELGINAIYFNPIFEGESMHKYDTADFRHIDDNFGVLDESGVYPPNFEGETADPDTWVWSPSDKVFLDFIEEAHSQGFKVVIDGVFNHVGTAHPFFQDVLENGQDSEFADWFEITDWGDGTPESIQYLAWDKPNGALPVFKKDAKLGLAEGPRQHIFDITKRWLDPDGDPTTRDGIDGWRLDVPGDIPHPFWVEWRKVVKEANPDAYITGEIWQWADAWLKGDQFDAVMNYQFAMATQDFLIDQSTANTPSEFLGRLEELYTRYPVPVTYAMQNLMSSHDTDRLASMFVNPDRPYDGANRPQDNAVSFSGPMYSERKPDEIEREKMRQLVFFQHSFVGAPMTYYGDEAGMWGPDDPSNRMPLPWPDQGEYQGSSDGFDEATFDMYRHAIAMRNTLPVLRTGDFEPVMADDATGIVAFKRTGEDGSVAYVVLNKGDAAEATLELVAGEYVDVSDPANVELVDGEDGRPRLKVMGESIRADGRLTLNLPANGVAVLVHR